MMNDSDNIHKIQCGKCGYLLAMTDRDHVSVKTSETLLFFYGGMIVLTCKLCQTLNLVADDDYEKTNPEKVFQAEKSLNSVRAVFMRWYPSRDHRTDRT